MYLRLVGSSNWTVGAVYKKGAIKDRYVAITHSPFDCVNFNYLGSYDKFVKLNIKILD